MNVVATEHRHAGRDPGAGEGATFLAPRWTACRCAPLRVTMSFVTEREALDDPTRRRRVGSTDQEDLRKLTEFLVAIDGLYRLLGARSRLGAERLPQVGQRLADGLEFLPSPPNRRWVCCGVSEPGHAAGR